MAETDYGTSSPERVQHWRGDKMKGKSMKRPVKKKPKMLPTQVQKEEQMPQGPGLAEGVMPFKKVPTGGRPVPGGY